MLVYVYHPRVEDMNIEIKDFKMDDITWIEWYYHALLHPSYSSLSYYISACTQRCTSHIPQDNFYHKLCESNHPVYW